MRKHNQTINRPWTDSELRFVVLSYMRRRPRKYVARGVNRSVEAIRQMIWRHGHEVKF